MSTEDSTIRSDTSRRDSFRMCGSAALTYAVGLWIVLCNPYIIFQTSHPPLDLTNVPPTLAFAIDSLLVFIGRTPAECMIRLAIVAFVFQTINVFTYDDDGQGVDIEHYRPYVFWRAVYRFLEQVEPFLRRQRLDSPPSTSLTEYERITIRYFFVKLIFLPMMISFFYGTFQHLLGNLPWQASAGTAQYYRHLYIVLFNILMLIDIGWFATGISMETKRFSPIKMVDPYASGWLVTLACYPPLVYITGQYFSWQPPEFPTLFQADVAKYFMIAGLLLYTFYVLADISFGLKTGNLVYRGLVDKGPYRVIRHPMYASKNIAWCLFTVPAINFHFVTHALPFARSVHIPMLAANWGMVAPLLAWVTIYAMRGITEERYLLAFPEYQEYCKRVRYRFIPGVL